MRVSHGPARTPKNMDSTTEQSKTDGAGSLALNAGSASDLIDTLDMMRDEFQRIIACPGCNAEIEDLANRAQLKLIQHVPVIVQRDRAERKVAELRYALLQIIENQETKLAPDGWILATARDALSKPNAAGEPRPPANP